MSTAVDETHEIDPEAPPETLPEPPDEPETPDTDDEPEAPETPPEPAPEPSGADDAAMAKLFDRAQAKGVKYLKDLKTMLGPHGDDLSLCPRCSDFLPGTILPLSMKPVAADQAVAVKLSIGEGAEPTYIQADDAEVCPGCGGEGRVLTGSHVAKFKLGRCRHCKGRGFIGPRTVAMEEPAPATNGHVEDDFDPAPEPTPTADPWGRVKGDPLYGVMPGYEPE